MATTLELPSGLTIPVKSLDDLEALSGRRHRVLLTFSDEMKARLEDLVRRTGYDEGELIDVAIACFMMGLDAVEEGKRVGVVEDDRAMSLEFSGFRKDDPTDE